MPNQLVQQGRLSVADDLVAVLPRLRRYARVLIGGQDGADELVVATLAGARRTKRTRTPDADLATWLFGLMRDAHRHRRPAPARFAATRPADCASSSGAGARRTGAGIPDICAQVLELPADEREVLMLATVEGLSYAQIAEMLDMQQANVMHTLVRARDRLSAVESAPIGPSS